MGTCHFFHGIPTPISPSPPSLAKQQAPHTKHGCGRDVPGRFSLQQLQDPQGERSPALSSRRRNNDEISFAGRRRRRRPRLLSAGPRFVGLNFRRVSSEGKRSPRVGSGHLERGPSPAVQACRRAATQSAGTAGAEPKFCILLYLTVSGGCWALPSETFPPKVRSVLRRAVLV